MSRTAEMDRILTRLKGPKPAAFVLAGAAGVGKSRLASEAAKSAASLGYATAEAVASRATAAIPFGPFAPFLPETGHTPGDMLGLLKQAGEAILARAGTDGRLLLVVDDAQLLDDGSAALVHQLVRGGTCSVVASLRTPGHAPEPVTALWKDGLAERIDLRAWNEAETESVLAAVLGGPVASGSVRQFFEVSGGNALYLRELIIGGVDSGTLRETGGIWSLHEPLTAPGRLVELVASRLSGLAPDTVAALELLAVGEPLGMAVLEKLTDPASVEEAEAQGFAHVHASGRRTEARLAHPVYGEALRKSLPRSRLRRISAALASAFEWTGARRSDDLLRLGRWQLDAGGPAEPALLSRAARRASEIFDNELAARLAEAALDRGGGADAGLALGEAMFRSGRHQEAESVLASVAPLCANDTETASVASARAHILHQLLDDPAAASNVIDAAIAAVTEPAARLALLGRLATMKVFEPDLEGALAAAEPLLASGDDALASRGTYVSSVALALLGRSTDALAMAGLGIRTRRRARGTHQLPEAQLIGAIFGRIAAGQLASAEDDAAAGYQGSLAGGDKDAQATFLFMSGLVLLEQGQLARASKAFLDGASVNRAIHDRAALRWCLAGITLAEAMRGHADRAAAAAAEVDELPVGTMAVYEPDLIERSRAWVSVSAGELSRAREILTAAADRAAAAHLNVAEARLLHDIARLGNPDSVAPRLASLAESTDGEFVAALARHAAAMVSEVPADMENAADSLSALGANLLAAEAYLAAGTAYRSAGLARLASAAERNSAELLEVCGDARTPGLSAAADTQRLTSRELEVASMAAAGASSREIAARLVLSVRTVDNHLQNAYSKLGVTSRDELARTLRS